jgi:small subunit ribosomal protein S6
MNFYECIFIARQDLSNAQVDGLTEKFSSIITEHNGKIEKTEYCNLRTLAYPIRKNRKGHYVLLNITCSAETMKELERQMRLNEDILRYQTVAVEEHETGPSALLKSSRYQGREHYKKDYDSSEGDEETPSYFEEETTSEEGAN